jgi:hypothetical protein
MRIQLVSDLHLENDPGFRVLPAPGAEVLILAGDVGSYQAGSQLAEPGFGLERFSPLAPGSPWRTVIYVPGNHEYDGLEFSEAHAALKATCERLGIVWLEREVLVMGAVRFVGTTLWTDFDAFAREAAPGSQREEQLRGKAFRAANFYLSKNTCLKQGEPMLAESMRELGVECQTWLRRALATPFDGITVAVTHFAPSLRSADPRYGLTAGTAGFCNALDDLLPHAQYWLHGHLHCQVDYVVQGRIGQSSYSCRVIANPVGYPGKGERDGYRPELVIELPD